MERRTFYIALGVPRGVDPEAVSTAYRRVVARYREALEQFAEKLEAEPPEKFAVARSYSERRHAGTFDDPEPLIPERGESELDRFFDGFVAEAIPTPRARRAGKDLFVELRMDADAARRGGSFPVHIPVWRECPSCADRDETEQLVCRNCDGTRRIAEDRTVDVFAPPGVRDGEAARIAMEDVGIDETDLIVKVIVG